MVFIIACVVFTGMYLSGRLAEYAREEIKKDNRASIEALTGYFIRRMQSADNSVRTLAGSPGIKEYLATPEKPGEKKMANSVLDRYRQELDLSVCYLMNPSGVTVATSNRNTENSFLGKDYSFRAYYRKAIKGEQGRYFALGITSGKRGYYSSYPVRDGKRIVGVAVVKKDMDDIERHFRNFGKCFLVDPNGIIFISGESSLLFKSLFPISPEQEEKLIASRQFGKGPFPELSIKRERSRSGVRFNGMDYIVTRMEIGYKGWSIVYFTPQTRVTVFRMFGLASTAFLAVLLGVFYLVIYFLDRSNRIIRQSEERFQQIALTSQDWIWEIDKEGRFTYSNQAVKDIMGYEPDEVLGRKFSDFFLKEKRDELILRTKALFSSRQPFICVLLEEMTRGGEVVIHESTGAPIFNERSEVVGYRGVNKDITDRKRSEETIKDTLARLKKTQQQLIQAEKMSAVGQLAGGVAHEVKTPLATIIMAIEYLQKRIGEEEHHGRKLKIMKKAAKGADKIVRGLLDFSRPSPLKTEKTDINTIIRSSLELVEKQLTLKGIKIKQDMSDKLPGVRVDVNKMNQVFLNIIINSLQSMPEGGQLYISTHTGSRKVSYGKEMYYVTACIKDTGEGIGEENIGRVFDPFFTTKSPGEGTGLGLSITKAIIEEHSGKIHIESVKGEGTTVCVHVPAEEDQ
jgi:PAS domain S-box-containing protein